MTLIENDSPKVQYTGPFIKGQLLPLTFPYIATEDVKMIIDDKPAIFNVDYEIITEPNDEHPVAYPNSAYIKSDLPNAKQITLYRVTPLDQQAPFPQQSKFRSERVEQALDKLTMQQQEQEEQLSRCIIAPITLETFNGQLPAPAADQALKWNTEGTELENYDIIGEQEAFETEVNTKFEEQSTAFENRISEFEENTNAQFAGFRAEINENLETVLDAAAKLENLDNSVQAAENAASQANAAAARADEAVVAADQAVDEAESAADQAEDALTEVKEFIQNAEHEISQYYSLPMFTPIWSDHILNDASYLRADTFSWHNGEIYETAYKILLAEFTSPECVHKFENGVTYRRTPSGFKIADPNKHDAVLEAFISTGKSWFYVIDPDNKRFKLPRTQYSFTGIRDMVGGDVEAGLPSLTSNSTGAHTHTRGTMNITGTFGALTAPSGAPQFSGAISKADNFSTATGVSHNNAGHHGARLYTLDASQSWSGATSSDGAHTHTITDSAGVVGKADTVQPPATQMYLYFFIGNYARPATDINIGELVEVVNNIDFEATLENAKNEITVVKNNCITEVNNTALGAKADRDLSNLTENGENKFNSILNNKITNCLKEVPQNIKLELNKDVLTLKAGSVVTVPNGKNTDGSLKFDYITIESDIVVGNPYTNAPISLVYHTHAQNVGQAAANAQESGTSSTITAGYWYDTTNNIVNRISSSSVAFSKVSLPIGIINASNGSWSSINQVFNGFGYIGSTVWADKGVKALLPNGRNEDGTLRNLEITSQKVSIVTNASFYQPILYVIDGHGTISNSTTDYWIYDEKSNHYKHDNQIGHFVILAQSDTTNGVISNFQTKPPVNLVHHDELQECHVIIETYVNGTSWYRVWSDGWCEQGAQSLVPNSQTVTTISLLKNFINTNYQVLATNNPSSLHWSTHADLQITAKTVNNFGISANVANNNKINWQASGYIW